MFKGCRAATPPPRDAKAPPRRHLVRAPAWLGRPRARAGCLAHTMRGTHPRVRARGALHDPRSRLRSHAFSCPPPAASRLHTPDWHPRARRGGHLRRGVGVDVVLVGGTGVLVGVHGGARRARPPQLVCETCVKRVRVRRAGLLSHPPRTHPSPHTVRLCSPTTSRTHCTPRCTLWCLHGLLHGGRRSPSTRAGACFVACSYAAPQAHPRAPPPPSRCTS